MKNEKIIEEAAKRSLELTNAFFASDNLADGWATYHKNHEACRVSFEFNGQKYKVLRQKEDYGKKIQTRYYIVKKVGKRVIKEKDSPIKLAEILKAAKATKEQEVSNHDIIRGELAKTLLPF